MIDSISSGKPDKNKMKIRQQIIYNFVEILELYPQYSACQHLSSILRRKNETGKEFHYWKDDELLSKIEKHKEELEGEDLMNIEDTFID